MPYIIPAGRPAFLELARNFVTDQSRRRVLPCFSALLQAAFERIYCAPTRYSKLNSVQGVLDCQLSEWLARLGLSYPCPHKIDSIPVPTIDELESGERETLMPLVDRLVALVLKEGADTREGSLNFFITETLIEVLLHYGSGALDDDCVTKSETAAFVLALKSHWYRRVAVPYEEQAAAKNTDCRFPLVAECK